MYAILDSSILNVPLEFSNTTLLTIMIENQEQKPVPFFQALTDYTDFEFVTYFIREMLRENVPSPNLFFIESPSLEFLEAACISLNHMNFMEYNDICYKFFTKESTELPMNTIVVNVFSLLKSLEHFKYFSNEDEDSIQDKEIKKFYFKCLLYLSTINNFAEWILNVSNLFILLKSQCKNEHCLSIETNFLALFKTDLMIKYIETFKNYEGNYKSVSPIFEIEIGDCNPMYNYILKVYKENEKKCAIRKGNIDEEPNVYYSEHLFKKIMTLLVIFPAWTNLVSFSKYGETDSKMWPINKTIVQKNYLEIIKKRVFNNSEKLCTVDFLKIHSTLLKEIAQQNRDLLKSKFTCSKKNLDDKQLSALTYNFLDIKENWKNKIELQCVEINAEKCEGDQSFRVFYFFLQERTKANLLLLFFYLQMQI